MSDILKIAMFGHKRIPSREGGVEIVVAELATGMAARGHSVVCYNRRGHNVAGAEFDGERLSEYRGVALKEVLTLDAKGLAAVSSSFFASLRAAFGGYDVVNIHAEGPAFLCALPKLFGKKVIVTVHGLDHQRAKWGRFASAYILAGEKRCPQSVTRQSYGKPEIILVDDAPPDKSSELCNVWDKDGILSESERCAAAKVDDIHRNVSCTASYYN